MKDDLVRIKVAREKIESVHGWVRWLLVCCFMLIVVPIASADQSTSDNPLADDLPESLPEPLLQTLTAIAAKISNNANRSIGYHERRDSELLDAPIRYQGELQFEATTKTLTKTVSTPIVAQVILTPTHLTWIRPGKKDRRVKLTRRPQLQALHAGMTALFTGDVNTLAKTFEIEYQEDTAHGWRIDLIPVSKALKRKVDRIQVAGYDDTIATMTTELANGEEQTMTFEH